MQTVITGKGWREITNKNIIVDRFGEKPLMLVDQWVAFNIKHLKLSKKRKLCSCCKKKWTDIKGKVNIVFTNNGSKAVCDDCFKKLRKIFDSNE